MSFPSKKTRFSRTNIKIFVPSTKLDKRISNNEFKKRIKETQLFLTNKFGGTTKLNATGTYIFSEKSKKGKLIEEPIATVEAFIPKPKLSGKDKIEVNKFLKEKKNDWNQEALAVTFQSAKRKLALHFI